MPTASLPMDFIYSSALGNAEFLKAQRLLRSILVPALSETSILTSNAFLQSPLQTLNCRMIQGSLSSQISLYSQRGAVFPRVFQSAAIGCPVLDSMTISLPNNSASHKNIMIQAKIFQDYLKTERVILFAFLRTLMSGLQAAPLQPRFSMWSNCMWALDSWLWASCSKKPWYIKIKRLRKQMMERPSCFPAVCSSAAWQPVLRAGWEAPRSRHRWMRTPGWESLRVQWAGTTGLVPLRTCSHIWYETGLFVWVGGEIYAFPFSKGSHRLDPAGLCTQIRWDPSTWCTERTALILVLAYCNHRFSASVSTPLPCSSPRQVSVQSCHPLL